MKNKNFQARGKLKLGSFFTYQYYYFFEFVILPTTNKRITAPITA